MVTRKMAMHMKIRCPECDQVLDAPETAIGNKVQCQSCGHKFILDVVEGEQPKQADSTSQTVIKKTFFWKMCPAALLLLALFGGTAAWVWYGNKEAQNSQSAVVSEASEASNTHIPEVSETSEGLDATEVSLPVNTPIAEATEVQPEKKLDEAPLKPDSEVKAATVSEPAIAEYIQAVADAVPGKPIENPFDFDDWEERYGKVVSIEAWREHNPHPFAKRFNPKVSYMLPRYFINLGPLGVRTWMHDQNWAHRYPTALKKFPEVLIDQHGVIQNAFEIIHVQDGGPAHGHLKTGDLILEIEGEPIKSAQWTYLDKEISIKKNRSLEIHAGQMIDRAEGRGAIKVKVLRLPESGVEKISKGVRSWSERELLSLKREENATVSLPLENTNMLKIEATTQSKKHGRMLFDQARIVNKQGLAISLWDLERIVFKNAWGRVEADKKTGHWKALAPCEFHFGIPPGDWRFEGRVIAGPRALEVKISSLERGCIDKRLTPYVKTLEFKIPQIGSFGDTFEPEGAKVRNYCAMLAKRLARQQLPDGSWPDPKGLYVTPAFYTSMCGLGLLSTGDSVYDENIKRAAHYVAYSGQFSGWSYTRGLAAMFLGEYYLRSKDASILPGLSQALRRAEENLLVGHIAGHQASPGYGGSGYIGGSGPIACAFAIAEYTPAKFTRGTATKMLQRIQSLAIRGTTPYGRATGRSVKKKVFDLNLRWPGQGGSAGTAPFYMASKINGASKFFTEIVSSRFITKPYGDADYGHGTHTLPFVLGSTAISLCSQQAHKENMEAFLWKLTTHRGFDGLIVNNANPLEFHSGEAVMGKPWWSTGAYLLMLNSHKKNMAITGKPEYMAQELLESPLIHDADMKVWRQTLRQWCVVESALGSKAPRVVKKAVRELEALEKNPDLGANVFKFMEKRAVECARAVSRLSIKDKKLKNYCMEILLGVNHDIYLDVHHWDKTDNDKKKLAKLAKEKGTEAEYLRKAAGLQLKIKSHTFFSYCNGVLPDTVKSENPLPGLASNGLMVIKDERGRLVKGLPRTIPLGGEAAEQEYFIADGAKIKKLYAHFKYQCGGLNIDYVREIRVNREKNFYSHSANLRKLWIPGELLQYYNGWNVHFRLPNGMVYHGATSNQKPQIFDIHGKKRPEYILRWGNKSANFPVHYPLAKGHKGMFLVSTGTAWEGFVHEIRIRNPLEKVLEIDDISFSSENAGGRTEAVHDSEPDTYTKIVMNARGKAVLTFKLRKPELAKSLYILSSVDRRDLFTCVLEARVGSEWKEISWGKLNGLQSFQPIVDSPSSNQYRLSISGMPDRGFNLYELHLFKE